MKATMQDSFLQKQIALEMFKNLQNVFKQAGIPEDPAKFKKKRRPWVLLYLA